MKRKAYAKINLGLDIVGLREGDGYHLLRMVMQTLQLCDIVTVERVPGKTGIHTKTDNAAIPDDKHNLAYRAAALLAEEFGIEDGIDITIEKHIPASAGLAGGSTDAAAVLRAVNEEFDLGLSAEQLMDRGIKLGADVPYCIVGGTQLAEGIGEKLTAVEPALRDHGVLLVKPPEGASTQEIYHDYDLSDHPSHPDIDGILDAIRTDDFDGICSRLGNVLEDVTIPKVPVIGRIKDFLKNEGADGVLMSGSGSTVFALFRNKDRLAEAARAAEAEFPDADVIQTETISNI
ncbi:4-diphosphocytidyl-2-C-methyl-D-erythritol kinase [Lachnospiraceae bacterium]|nr:4-diphosphocytidyl-2-C-methyl-D-erythritol kinase [Lachnospiraceae bacterium]